VPQGYKTDEGIKLGLWVYTQRQAYSKGKLSKERRNRLKELGFVLDPLGASWEENFGLLCQYRDEKGGDCLVPQGYKTDEGVKLGLWVYTQRQAYMHSKGKLSEERRNRLEELGFVWD